MGQSCSRLAGSTGCLAIWFQGEEAETARLHEGEAQNWLGTASFQSIVWGKWKSLSLCRQRSGGGAGAGEDLLALMFGCSHSQGHKKRNVGS